MTRERGGPDSPPPPPAAELAPGAADRVFRLLLRAYLVYAVLFIFRTSFVIEGTRYFSLFDDAMVSMRYARNLVHGFGLVWNPGGERVEGYTNLLWVLYMSLAHLLPLPASKVSVVVQLSGAVFLALTLCIVDRIAALCAGGSPFVRSGAVLLTAFYLPLNNWALQGTEVGLLTLLATVAVWHVLRSGPAQRYSIAPYACLGIATLVRLDMVVPYLVVLGFLVAADRTNRARHLAWGLSTLALFVLAQTLFRLAYYGDVLPNTYYLKLTGYPALARVMRGAFVAVQFVYRMNPLVFLLPVFLVFVRRDRSVLLLASLVAGQLAYSIYVGGDGWEGWGGSNRFVSIAMPAFFVLFCLALAAIASRAPARYRRHAGYGILLLLLASLVQVNAINDFGALREWLLIRRTLNVEANAKYVRIGILLNRLTDPRARVAVVWAGATPYFADRYSIDLLGKSDRRIARAAMHVPADGWRGFWPGHLKWDLAYSIGELKPDVVVRWFGTIPEDMPGVDAYRAVNLQGAQLYLRRGSPSIWWDTLPAGDQDAAGASASVYGPLCRTVAGSRGANSRRCAMSAPSSDGSAA